MLHLKNNNQVICYTLANFQFGFWTPWGKHRLAETCSGSESLYGSAADMSILGGHFVLSLVGK